MSTRMVSRSILMKLSTNKCNKSHEVANSPGHRSVKPVAWCLGILAASFFLFLFLGFASVPRPKVYVKKLLPNGHYQLIVDNRLYVIKGVCYNPIPIGQTHDYDWWSDPNKPWLVDGKLMQKMGINTVRLYAAGEDPVKVRAVIRDLYNNFGIRTVMGNWLGYWQYPCPLYGNQAFQEKVKQDVLGMVELYKDEPGILFWVLGNENNYSCLGQIRPWTSEEVLKEPDPLKKNQMRAQIYYSFVNDLAKEIHKIDFNHPVAMGNGELVGLEYAKKHSPDIDIIACVIYRGKTFGNLFNSLKMTFDRPVFLAEFGADAYDAFEGREDQNMQAFFLESQWQQIYKNLANNKDGAGNCLGGTMFEWSDEWWKHNDASPETWVIHDSESNWSNPAYYFDIKAKENKNMNEEWFGIVALSQEMQDGISKRVPRKAYYVIREFWKHPNLNTKKKIKYE